jgi:hypothetical protein
MSCGFTCCCGLQSEPLRAASADTSCAEKQHQTHYWGRRVFFVGGLIFVVAGQVSLCVAISVSVGIMLVLLFGARVWLDKTLMGRKFSHEWITNIFGFQFWEDPDDE